MYFEEENALPFCIEKFRVIQFTVLIMILPFKDSLIVQTRMLGAYLCRSGLPLSIDVLH